MSTVHNDVLEGLQNQMRHLLETARTAREAGAKFEKDAQRSFDHANYSEARAAELQRIIDLVETHVHG